MRTLERNKQTFYYSTYLGKEPVSEDGYLTGETRKKYSEPIKLKGNISPASGSAQVEQFGSNLNYDKVIVLDNYSNCTIDENTVLCVEKEPTYIDDELVYDYVVTEVAKSLNSISIAISKVKVD